MRRLDPIVGILRKAVADQPVERRRRRGRDRRERRRVVLEDGRDERCLALPREGLAPGGHLVEGGSEREDVASRVGLLSFELLGSHVLEGAEKRSLGRHGRRVRRHCGKPGQDRRRRSRFPFGKAEIQELHSRLRHHDVAGLQVPVHDPLPVRLVESVGDLEAVTQNQLGRKRASGEPRRERLAFEVLHDDVVGFALAADVVQGADVRVGDRRDRLRLPLEALAKLGVARESFRKDLDRDLAAESRVLRLVDLAHPSRADRREDLVGAEARAARRASSTSSTPPPSSERA